MKIELQEVPESNCNNTDYINTNYSDTDSIHIISDEGQKSDKVDAVDAYREIIHDNIDYGIL